MNKHFPRVLKLYFTLFKDLYNKMISYQIIINFQLPVIKIIWLSISDLKALIIGLSLLKLTFWLSAPNTGHPLRNYK